MALLDVLRFDCSIDNEIARNAMGSFGGMLEKAFEQYKKLWNEYLALRKYCEDADFKIPFELFESDNHNNKSVITPDISQVSSDNTKLSTSMCKSTPTSCSLDITWNLNNNKSAENHIEKDELLASPILLKKHSRSKMIIDTPSYERTNIINTTPRKKYKRSSPLGLHVSPTPEKNIRRMSRDKNKFIEEEIIQGSPSKSMRSNLKMKSLKLKKKTPVKLARKDDTRSSAVKLPLRETNQSSLSRYLLPVYTPIKKDKQFSVKKEETIGSRNETIDDNCDTLSSFSFPTFVDDQYSCFEKSLSNSTKKTRKIEVTKDIKQAEENKNLKSTSQMYNASSTNSSTSNDETFYLLGENLEEKSTFDINVVKDIKENRPESNISELPFVKKNLMNSFDIPPEKKDLYIDKPSKKKLDRAQMTGVACWECKKYYTNLGLSEEETKARQNQCSRHKIKRNERESTPEGFWNPVFPDTCASDLLD
ncbi:hypothetical protein ANTQUA_LOCUS7098 [Anthophora quadrimaculata]